MREDTQAIFRQLAQTPGGGEGGVKCIIENHDAWVHSEEVQAALAAKVRAGGDGGRSRDAARIEAQRARLQRLVTPLRRRSAG